MRISVTHSTVYRYDAPVFLEPHTFRLRPREDGVQRLVRHEVGILPQPRGPAVCLDKNENVVLEVCFEVTATEMSARSSFEIETLRDNPFDFLLPPASVLGLPPFYSEPERRTLAPYMAAVDRVGKFARSVADGARGQTLAFLAALTRNLHQGWRHVLRPDGPPESPAKTLRDRQGSCRDLSMLFCAT